jgi:predicted nucleic acid-binding protein
MEKPNSIGTRLMPGSFLDSNIVLYLASEDLRKADRAQELVAEGGTTSVQVLNEIANISRRKMGLSWAETRNFLLMIRGLLNFDHEFTQTPWLSTPPLADLL